MSSTKVVHVRDGMYCCKVMEKRREAGVYTWIREGIALLGEYSDIDINQNYNA